MPHWSILLLIAPVALGALAAFFLLIGRDDGPPLAGLEDSGSARTPGKAGGEPSLQGDARSVILSDG